MSVFVSGDYIAEPDYHCFITDDAYFAPYLLSTVEYETLFSETFALDIIQQDFFLLFI